ncbi:MAG: hypothetical protein ACTHOH_04410 [Lysobacteraceae bacterium]
MTISTFATPASSRPAPGRLLFAAGVLGIGWNLFGIVQWTLSLGATPESLMGGGLTRAQADLYLALPVWMTLAFAVGVFGGLLGSIALLLRSRHAVPILGVSLVAYLVLFAGDAALGLFTAIPHQLPILSLVVAIAVALSAIAWHTRAALR